MAGLDASGFTPKSLDTVRTELGEAFRSVFGPSFAVDADSVSGELIGILAAREADLWALAAEIYASAFPDGATKDALDRLCLITGVTRRPAAYSRVVVTMAGTPGTVVPAGTRFSDPTTGRACTLDSASTLVGGLAANTCTATAVGAFPFPAGSITHIDTPRAGLTSVINNLDGFYLGSEAESDAQLRIRRQNSLRALGGGSVDAIRARLLEVTGVTECAVYENVTDATDGYGVPPHAIEVVILGGAAQAIGDALLAVRPAGILTYGTTSATSTDSNSVAHTMSFSRPVDVPIYVDIAVLYSGTPPDNLAARVKAALVAYGATHYSVGAPVRSAPLGAEALGVTSVVDVAHCFIGMSPSPSTSTTVTPTNRQRAVLDTSRITVTATRVS